MRTLQILFAIFLLAITAGCNKSSINGTGGTTNGTTMLKVRMMDAPGNFTEVNIDLQAVEVKVNENTTVNLNVNAGVYNLLDFVNGLDTLIASASVPSGTLSQVRLILGPNNTVKVDGVTYPLATPSAEQSGLKLNVHNTLVPGVEYMLLLDFDANQSVVLQGNGEYKLKPVIRTVSLATSGSIHGTITPAAALPSTISASDGVNSYTTVTNPDGHFLLRGVVPGVYTVTITPQPPFSPVVVTQVAVSMGAVWELGGIVF